MAWANDDGTAAEVTVDIPVLVPLTGFLALEGTSQKDGALLALRKPPPGMHVRAEVADTATSPETAINALEDALAGDHPIAAVGPILGTQMLAIMPVAADAKLPLLTVSGTSSITQRGNPYVFRFFPSDAVVKAAQVRYAIETDHPRHPAVIYQTTAYGQSGRAEIDRQLREHGIAPSFEDGLDVTVTDMRTTIAKAIAAGSDVFLLHLHSVPTALFMRALHTQAPNVPVVSGSALASPATLGLLQPAEIKGACAESGTAPMARETPAMSDFVSRYQAQFHADPDSYALGQYDAMEMLFGLVSHGAVTSALVTDGLSTESYKGLGMTYRSDGHGDMAHSAVIVCFDGTAMTPRVVRHYDIPPAP